VRALPTTGSHAYSSLSHKDCLSSLGGAWGLQPLAKLAGISVEIVFVGIR
jgi:hypothetical protein